MMNLFGCEPGRFGARILDLYGQVVDKKGKRGWSSREKPLHDALLLLTHALPKDHVGLEMYLFESIEPLCKALELMVDEYKPESKRIQYKNGGIYEGEVDEQGKPCGHGTLTYVGGDRRTCEWTDGVANGPGIIYFKEVGQELSGNFKNGVITGVCTATNEYGIKYIHEREGNKIFGPVKIIQEEGQYIELDVFAGTNELDRSHGYLCKGQERIPVKNIRVEKGHYIYD
jgi:hypothetical protein